MSGRVGDSSVKQEELLTEFKTILSDVLEPKHNDHLLFQFLRARNFDLKKSEDMFRKHLQWRKKIPEEYMVSDYKCPDLMKKYYGAPFLGFDREGSPVRLLRVGHMDLKGIVQCCKLQDLVEYAAWCLDTDKKNTKHYNEKLGRYVETRTFIIDLEGLSIRQATKSVLELLVAYLKMYEANYPENLKVAYVINIPYFFAFLFNIVKSILSEDTVRKIKIFAKDGFQEELTAIMDPKIIPECFGGSRTDENGDPTCQSLFGLPGLIPNCYYLKNQRRLSVEDDGVRELSVGRRSKKEIPLYADAPESTILWEIEVSQQDLNFGLFYKKEVGDHVYLEEVVPFQKIGGIYGPSTGNYITKKAGKYVMIFDNGFSLVRSKQVFYRCTVMPPVLDNLDTIPY